MGMSFFFFQGGLVCNMMSIVKYATKATKVTVINSSVFCFLGWGVFAVSKIDYCLNFWIY
jgi:hypothetical protein